jgi:hypothetical protein
MYTTLALAAALCAVTFDGNTNNTSRRAQRAPAAQRSTVRAASLAKAARLQPAPAEEAEPSSPSDTPVEADAPASRYSAQGELAPAGLPADDFAYTEGWSPDGPHPLPAHGAWSPCDHCPGGGGVFGGRCGLLRCGWNCRFKTRQGFPCIWRTTCDMPPHIPYQSPWDHYYYFRPYHYLHVPQQQEVVDGWGWDVRNPYSNEMFKDIYEGLDVAEIEDVPPSPRARPKPTPADGETQNGQAKPMEAPEGDQPDESLPEGTQPDNGSGRRLRILVR